MQKFILCVQSLLGWTSPRASPRRTATSASGCRSPPRPPPCTTWPSWARTAQSRTTYSGRSAPTTTRPGCSTGAPTRCLKIQCSVMLSSYWSVLTTVGPDNNSAACALVMIDKGVFWFWSNRRLTIRSRLRRKMEKRQKHHPQKLHALFTASMLFSQWVWTRGRSPHNSLILEQRNKFPPIF